MKKLTLQQRFNAVRKVLRDQAKRIHALLQENTNLRGSWETAQQRAETYQNLARESEQKLTALRGRYDDLERQALAQAGSILDLRREIDDARSQYRVAVTHGHDLAKALGAAQDEAAAENRTTEVHEDRFVRIIKLLGDALEGERAVAAPAVLEVVA